MSRRALIGGSVSAGAVVWGAACAFVYWRAFGRIPHELRQPTPADYGVEHETLDVRTADGIHLAAWYLPGKLAAAIVVSGGYRRQVSDVLGISAALNRAGFHVIAYGWRGTPGSDAAAHTLGVYERHDLVAVLNALEARLGRPAIGLLGYSMGGAVSISVAAGDARVRAVCTDSAFADPSRVVGDRIRRSLRLPGAVLVAPVMALLASRTGARLSDFRPLEVVGQIAPRPLFLIHGEADRAVPVANAHWLFAASGEPKELWLLPDVAHVGAYFSDRSRYVERVTGFFTHALVGTGSRTP